MALTRVSGDLIGQNTVTNQNIAASVQDAYGWRNRIINGDMRIDQRNAGASVDATASPAYCLDRYSIFGTGATSRFSVQQNAGSVTPPVGFTNYLGATSLTSYSVTAGDNYIITQFIEGNNVSDLAWGTANAVAVTLSFWVRSSLTGTFGGAFQNGALDRSYPFTYAINAANTWEYKTVTVPGDTTGTWLTDTGRGITVRFPMGAGSTISGTADAWAGSDFRSATGAVSVVGTSGATLYITGVQLEAGSVATAFERRDFGRELLMCMRYYYRTYSEGNAQDFGVGFAENTTTALGIIPFMVQMRVAPTALEQNGTAGDYQVRRPAAGTACTSVPTFGTATRFAARLTFTTTASLTAGQGIFLGTNANSPYLGFSAEL